MKIATWNVNGIRAREAQVLAFIERDRPDVVCLQELKASPEQVPASLCALEGYWCYWHGHKGYSGVGLHLRKETFPDKPVFTHPDFDHETRIVSATVGTANAGPLTVASIYVPNGGKDFEAKIRFLKALELYAASASIEGRTLVLCGDLNVTRTDRDVHPKERKLVIGQLPQERELLERILACGLVDVGRTLDPDNESLFTWWAPWRGMRERDIGWRLDYVLATTRLAERATACTVLKDVGTSDHAPVVSTFSLS
jgi:exodeoxyribonuclease III